MTASLLLALWWLGAPPEADVEPPRPRRHTLFLDFGGGTITPDGGPGPPACVPDELFFPPFLGSAEVAQAAVAEARAILEPYGVTVTATRPPASLEYTEVEIGGLPEAFALEETLNGLSCPGVDCDDASPADTVFVFSDKFAPSAAPSDPEDARARGISIGRIAVHEAAHAWGLEHAGGIESIMARFPSAADEQRFVVGCQALDVPLQAKCPVQHEVHCPPGEQDAHAELRDRFGLGEVDEEPPTVEIVSPADGDRFRPGDEITLEVDVRDDRGAVGWSLRVPQLEYRWDAPPHVRHRDLVLPRGELSFVVEAIDHAGNTSQRAVTVEVRVDAEPLPPTQTSCACRGTATGGWIGLVWLVFVRRKTFLSRDK